MKRSIKITWHFKEWYIYPNVLRNFKPNVEVHVKFQLTFLFFTFVNVKLNNK